MNHMRIRPISIVLILFGIAQVVAICTPGILSWDGSVYVGMGKYLYSGGMLGVWETLRPIGLPVLLGAAWKIGLDPYVTGQILGLVGAIAVLHLVYVLAERMRTGAGLFSAILLATTALFFSYASLPMTDIIATACALGSVSLVAKSNQRHMLYGAGILAALAFLFRFPHGLSIAVSGLVVVYAHFSVHGGRQWKELFQKMMWLAGGFATLVIPFFISNVVLYGDPLLPLRAGSGIIAHSAELYRQSGGYYFSALLRSSPFAVLALIPLALFVFRQKFRDTSWATPILFSLVYLGYFSFVVHKEFRYSLAFLPVVLVFAGVGVALVAEKIQHTKARIIVLGVVVLVAALSVARIAIPQKNDFIYETIGSYFSDYQKSGEAARVLTASPFVLSRANVKVVDTLYDDWREVVPKYLAHKKEITHVIIDSCTLEAVCRIDSGCTQGKSEAFAILEKDAHAVIEGTAGLCQVTVYELHTTP